MSEAVDVNPISEDLQSTTWALCVLLAWEAGDLTEGQVVSAFGIDRQQVRECKDHFIAAGLRLVQEDAQRTRACASSVPLPGADPTS